MKKNKMMRLASGLLVAVLITTSTISGTFAKYVTEDSATDSARVAKFGVVVTADGSLFGKTYLNATGDTPGADDADPATITVKSSNTEKVVAPGTKNGDKPISFAVSGTPEVDVRVVFEVKGLNPDGTEEETVKDIYLKSDKYADVTTGDTDDAFTAPETKDGKYLPVKFTLTQKGAKIVTDGTLAEVEAALEAITNDNIPAGTNLATTIGDFVLTWEWAYGTKADVDADPWDLKILDSDKADTYLGDLAAGVATIPAYTGDDLDVVAAGDAVYNLNTGLEISILVEQVD